MLQGHSLIAALITLDLSHRKPATAGTAAVFRTTLQETHCTITDAVILASKYRRKIMAVYTI